MKKSLGSIYKLIYQINTIDRIAILTIAVGLLIRIPLITHSTDLWREADTASIAHFFSINGFKILYPQIFWGGNGPGYVEAEFQLYPFIVSLLYYMFGEKMWLGRLISFLFSATTMITFYFFLAKKLLNHGEALLSMVLYAFSPILLRYNTAFMPEATMMCFYVGGLAFFIRWLDNGKFFYLLLAALSASLAILIKPTAIHIGLIFALLAIHRFGYRTLLKDWKVWFAMAFCLFPVVLYYLHAHNLYIEYGNTFGLLSGGDSKFGNFYYWLQPNFYYGLANIELLWVFGPLGAFVFLIGLLQSIKRRSYFLLIGLITLIIYYLIIPRYSGYSRGIQYHVFMAPFAALGFGIGVESLFNLKYYSRVGEILAWISIFAVVLWGAYIYKSLPQSGEDYISCGNSVQKVVSTNSLILVSTSSRSVDTNVPTLSENYQEPEIFFYSQRRGWSLPADWLTPGKFEEFRHMGAGYYIILDKDLPLLNANPSLFNYINSNLNQINSGIGTTCRIYQFK
jgi:4-amino-4-deoxy-L-arabinose transferase-like glycosyltransferase